MISRRTEKLSSLVDESFETVFVGIKYDVLEPLPQTKKVDCFQKLRKIFDGGKAAARKHVMKEANKLCNEIDEFYETLFTHVKYGVVKPMEAKNTKMTKK
jgi:hypothetical protein